MITKVDKALIVRDLCARLPYGVICEVKDEAISRTYKLTAMHFDCGCGFNNNGVFYGWASFDIKPYLRPLSSMTKEERNEFVRIMFVDIKGLASIYDYIKPTIEHLTIAGDWLNAHHFDYRGLIEKGLAIEVTEYNNPYKQEDTL